MRPVKFALSKISDRHGEIFIEEAIQRDGSTMYKVVDIYGCALGKSSPFFTNEPLPSSRNEEFLSEFRYKTIRDCLVRIKEFIDPEKQNLEEGVMRHYLASMDEIRDSLTTETLELLKSL